MCKRNSAIKQVEQTLNWLTFKTEEKKFIFQPLVL